MGPKPQTPSPKLQKYIKYIQKNGCSCFHLTRYWVLEIHIRDSRNRFGAFYEDMLLSDNHFQM